MRGESSDLDLDEEEKASDPDPFTTYLVGAAVAILISGGMHGVRSQGQWGVHGGRGGMRECEGGSTGDAGVCYEPAGAWAWCPSVLVMARPARSKKSDA